MARAGGGTAEFILNLSRLKEQVVLQFKRALQPAITDLKFDWQVDEQVNVCETSLGPRRASVSFYSKTHFSSGPLPSVGVSTRCDSKTILFLPQGATSVGQRGAELVPRNYCGF